MKSLLFLAAALVHRAIPQQLRLYPTGINATSTISPSCIAALNQTLSCDPFLLALASTNSYTPLGNATLQAAVCAPACGNALVSYHNSVQKGCSRDPNPWPGTPAVWAGDVLWSVFNRTCLKDPTTGKYCVDEIFGWASKITEDINITSLPKAQLCSLCALSLFQTVQGTSYSNYGANMVAAWTSAQSICGVKLPADVHPPVTNVTLPNTASSSSNASQTCISGRTYTVKPGDTCQTIAATYRVATGTLTIINALLPDCSNLLSDQKLCLPQACDTYLVRQGDTCASIAASFGLTIASLIAYNPAINGGCTNLIAGTNICLSPAAGTYTPTTISGVTTSPAGQYASSTVPAPGPTAAGTTKNCGMYYRVYPGDICQKISLNNSITVELFLQINSGVKASCDNLVPGLYYCVKPILGWNLTDTGPSTTAAPPAPTHSGTTGACYTWYIVQPGDYCALLQASFGLTFEQFRAWNPSIDDGCTNLLVGFAYCVHGKATTSSPTPGSMTSFRSGPTALYVQERW